jgi:hypothetical protein
MAVSPDILQEAEARQERILDADYSKVDIDEHVNSLSHLTKEQKDILTKTLKKRTQLFSGGLGTLNVKPVHLELNENAVPYHARAFPIPQSMEAKVHREMERLASIDVLRKTTTQNGRRPRSQTERKPVISGF